MNKDIEKLMKIQNRINRNMYHLMVETNLEDKYRWVLFLYFPDREDYFSEYNRPIMDSSVDSIDDLMNYLEKHGGFNGRW